MTQKYIVRHLGLADAKYVEQNHPDSLRELREKEYLGSTFVFLDLEPIPGRISPPAKSYQRAISYAILRAANAQVPHDEFDQREFDLDERTQELIEQHQAKADGLASKVNNPAIRLLTGPVKYREGQIIDFPNRAVILNKSGQWYLDKHTA